MEKNAPYKFVYLGHYVINMVFIIALLIIFWTGMNVPKLQDYLQMGAWCMGLLMVAYLWGRTFVVNDAYKGKRCLDRRTTRLLTFLMVLVDAALIYYGLGHELFLKPATFFAILWIGTFTYVACTGKLVLRRDNSVAA